MPDRPTRPLDAAVFDLDGTVWDSAPGILASIRATLGDYGVADRTDDELRGFLGPPLLQMLAELGVPEPDVEEARVTYRRHYAAEGEFACIVYPGVPELLGRLAAAGIRLATATSKGVEPTARMLEHFGLRGYFDVVAAASMTARDSSKVAVIGEALAGLGTDGGAGAAMIGDRSYDIEGGAHFGCLTVGVLWGYGESAELQEAGADALVSDCDELLALLLDDPGGD